MSEREKGTVRWFDSRRGYGFIRAESGEDLFVHFSAISGDSSSGLEEGDAVEFCAEEAPKGLRAVEVVRLPGAELESTV